MRFIGSQTLRTSIKSISLFVLIFNVPLVCRSQGPTRAAQAFEKKCYSCHNIGGGDKKGPDLKGVVSRRSSQWLHEYIQSPTTMNRRGDATTVELFKKFAPEVMPDQTLNPEEIDSLLGFIDTLTRKNENFIPAGAKLSRPVFPGDVAAGLQIFKGQAPLRNGGTPCISCHNLQALPRLGGGTLGPNLTAVNIKYRDPELISILQNPNFPTMKSVFGTRPLTDEEIVRLFALFQNSKLTNPTATVQTGAVAAIEPKFLIIGVVALILALLASDLIWKNRLRGVREELIRRRKP